MTESLLIRADASVFTGTGHVMRCVSLAHGWRETGGNSLFACAEILPAMDARLEADGVDVRRLSGPVGAVADADQTVQLARELDVSWVVADGYGFGAAFQRRIKDAGLRLLLLDDYGHADHYCADLVLNQNLGASAAIYASREPFTRLLLGTRYVLLSEQFAAYRGWRREIPDVARKVLVTLGGTDPNGVTAMVVDALQGMDVEARVVIGAGNPRFESIARIVHPPSAIIRDAPDMPALMAWADVAVAAGGTTAWELAFMGLPSIVMTLARNQQAVADTLDQSQIALKANPGQIAEQLAALLNDSARRLAMSRDAQCLVDGCGVRRVLNCMDAEGLSLRRVRPEDCELIWAWANDPEARAMSFVPATIPWDDHVKWFARRVDSPACLFFLAENRHGEPIGQIRYDISAGDATVSASVAKEARGHGYGTLLIRSGAARCFLDSSVERICAYVKLENDTSMRAFLAAGYVDAGIKDFGGHAARQLVLKRESVL